MISFEYKSKAVKFPLIRISKENGIAVFFLNKLDGIALKHPNKSYVGVKMQGWADVDGVYWDKDRELKAYTT